MKHLITLITVRPELVEGARCHARSWFDKLTTNGMEELML